MPSLFAALGIIGCISGSDTRNSFVDVIVMKSVSFVNFKAMPFFRTSCRLNELCLKE